jgi:hypothetical protein
MAKYPNMIVSRNGVPAHLAGPHKRTLQPDYTESAVEEIREYGLASNKKTWFQKIFSRDKK